MSDINLATVEYTAEVLETGVEANSSTVNLVTKEYVDSIAAQGGLSMKERTLDFTNFEYTYHQYKGSTIEHMPDTSKASRFMYCFGYCEKLTAIPPVNLANATHANGFMYRCLLIKELPETNFPKVTHAGSMCYSCSALTGDYVINIPKASYIPSMFAFCSKITNLSFIFESGASKDTINNLVDSCTSLKSITFENMCGFVSASYMFRNCSALKSIKGLDLTKVTYTTSFITGIFMGCSALETLELEGTIGISTLDLSPCVNLSKQSVLNVLNALITTTKVMNITFNQAHIDLLTDDELAIATNKGWTVLVK